MKKKLILIGTISLLSLLSVLLILNLEERKVYSYNSYALKKFDLKGPVQKIIIDQYIGFRTNNFPDNIFYRAGNRIISFTPSGIINYQKTENCIFTYNSDGELINKSFRNTKNIEYGYSNFSYSPNAYYKLDGPYYQIDKSQTYVDTNILFENGTKDKYYNGIDPVSKAISRNFVIDNKGDVLEEFGRDIQFGYFKYKYDTLGRLLYKYEGYQSFTIDSIVFKHTKDTIYNRFVMKEFDKYGNWQYLYDIVSDELILKRDIHYY